MNLNRRAREQCQAAACFRGRLEVGRGGQGREAYEEVGVADLDVLPRQRAVAAERVVSIEHALVGPDAANVLRALRGGRNLIPHVGGIGVDHGIARGARRYERVCAEHNAHRCCCGDECCDYR